MWSPECISLCGCIDRSSYVHCWHSRDNCGPLFSLTSVINAESDTKLASARFMFQAVLYEFLEVMLNTDNLRVVWRCWMDMSKVSSSIFLAVFWVVIVVGYIIRDTNRSHTFNVEMPGCTCVIAFLVLGCASGVLSCSYLWGTDAWLRGSD